MPTVLRIANLRFYFFSMEGPRPHIHVGLHTGAKVPQIKIWLDTLEVAYLKGFSKKAEKQIVNFVKQNHELLLNSWEDYFND